MTMPHSTLYTHEPDGNYTPAAAPVILAEAKRLSARALRRGRPVSNPKDAGDAIHVVLAPYADREVFAALFLDACHRILAFEILCEGSINRNSVYPRTIVIRALHHNAAAAIFAHNHPSGATKPSKADLELTQVLVQVMNPIDVRVLDHLIIGDETVSMRETNPEVFK